MLSESGKEYIKESVKLFSIVAGALILFALIIWCGLLLIDLTNLFLQSTTSEDIDFRYRVLDIDQDFKPEIDEEHITYNDLGFDFVYIDCNGDGTPNDIEAVELAYYSENDVRTECVSGFLEKSHKFNKSSYHVWEIRTYSSD
jgi:hypothetical protein